jgi:hypothetical protein
MTRKTREVLSAHACSEIGLKWFLFALHDLGTALGFVSVLDFFGVLSFPKTGEMCKTELRPFLTILGTRMRAKLSPKKLKSINNKGKTVHMKKVCLIPILILAFSLFSLFSDIEASSSNKIMVGVFYYPWYDGKNPGYHWNGHPGDYNISLPDTWWRVVDEPVLGWYNSSNRTVIDQHLDWFRYAGIDFGIISWWGPNSIEDSCTEILLNETSRYASWFRWVISIEDCYNVTEQGLGYLAYLRDHVNSTYLSRYHDIWLNESTSGMPYLFWMNAHDLENETVRGEAKNGTGFVTRMLGQANYSDWKTWTPYTYGSGATSAFPPSEDGFMCVMPRYDETRLDPNGIMGTIRNRCADPYLNGSDGQNVGPLNGEPLYDKQWKEVLSNASSLEGIKYVGIATWNDFTERTQIEPCYDFTSAYKENATYLLNRTKYWINILKNTEVNANTTVSWVIDGDTFNTTTMGKIRLADINAPELGEPGSYEARDFLINLVYNKTVYLDIDQFVNGTYRRDQYDRLVCVVYVEYNLTHYENVNEALLEAHHVVISDFPNEFDPTTWTLNVPKEAIPEFRSILILPLFIFAALAAAIVNKRKIAHATPRRDS